MAPDPVAPEDFEWDEEVTVLVTVRVKAKPNPDYYEGLQGRTPQDLAQSVCWRANYNDLERVDGWADMFGEAFVTDVQEGY